MIRSLSVIVLGTVLVWPVAAHAQRGGGGGGRGGSRGSGAVVVAPNSRVTTVNRAPQGGALGTPGAPGPWVGGTGSAGVVARVRQGGGGRFADVAAYQQYPYPVYNGGYYGIPTFTTGFDTGYYPPGVWPSPVVTPPIYPVPYYPEVLEQPQQSSPQDMILAAELARISQQLEELRNQNQAIPQPVPQAQYQAPSSDQRQAQMKPSMPTVIVMNDGRRIDTLSYAIADRTLWVFDQGTTQRFSLSDVDVNATQQENLKRGIRFLME